MTDAYQNFIYAPEVQAIFESHYDELFAVLEGENISAAFAAAKTNGDRTGMIREAAKYFRAKPDWKVCLPSPKFDTEAADRVVSGFMREVNVDWQFPDADVDFLFNPTKIHPPVNHEWLWQFNRMSYWPNLAASYVATSDEKYAITFNSHVLHWIAQCQCPTEKWNNPDSAWRTIEAGIRLMGNWETAFGAFRRSANFTDEALVLMIASMHRQARHLVAHPTARNWLMMEMDGAYTFASLFPELSDSEEIRQFAGNRLLSEMEGQLLPDGYQCELSPDYHSCVFHCGFGLYQVAHALGRENELPARFGECLKEAAMATVKTSTPGFTQPRTNDCYTMHTKSITRDAGAIFPDVPEFRFVNSDRKEGNPPAGETASVFMPYAGFAVMRNDWTADSLYMNFDVGPLGCAHVHQDKLNINLYRGAEELIFDDGGGQYEISDERTYGLSAYDHNTVLVDGMGQNRKEPVRSEEPINAHWVSTAAFDYAKAVYDGEFGDGKKPATHTREVRFCKPGFAFIKDLLHPLDGEAHTYEMLLHTDTCNVHPVAEYEGALLGELGKTYDILIVPVGQIGEISTHTGEKEPRLYGWYVGRNESNLHPATTVIRKIAGKGDCGFETLLIPVRHVNRLPKISVEGDTVCVNHEGIDYRIRRSDLSH